MKWIRRIVLVALALAAAVAVYLALRPRPVAVDVVRVTRGPLTVTVDELGKTRVKDRYLVSAPITGVVARLELEAGDAVAADAVLARLTPAAPPLYDARTRAELAARVDIARAAEAQARAAAGRAAVAEKFADDEADKIAGLAGRGAVTAHEAERAQLERDSAHKERESADFAARAAAHQITLAEASLAQASRSPTARPDDELVIRSPVAGRVLRVLHPDEGVVGPGTPLLELGDPAALEIVVEVLTSDAVGITAGAPVTFDGWGGDVALTGRVLRVEPSAVTKISALGVEEQRVTVVIAPSLEAGWARLGDGFRVDAHVAVWRGDDVVQAPASAVFRHGERWAVFVLADGHARVREVEVGHRAGRAVEITRGLAAGDPVVIHPSDQVVDGATVQPR